MSSKTRRSTSDDAEIKAEVRRATREANRKRKEKAGLAGKVGMAAARAGRRAASHVGRKAVGKIDELRELSGEDAADDTCEAVVGWTLGGVCLFILMSILGKK